MPEFFTCAVSDPPDQESSRLAVPREGCQIASDRFALPAGHEGMGFEAGLRVEHPRKLADFLAIRCHTRID